MIRAGAVSTRQFTHIILRNSAVGLATQIGIKVVSFAFSIVIVRHLGAAAYGQYVGVLAFGSLFVFFADLGLSPYLVREVARARSSALGMSTIGALYGNTLILRLVLAVLTGMLIIGTAFLTGRPLAFVGAVALGSVGLLFYSLQGTYDAILAGFERLDLTSGAKLLNQLVFIALGTIALFFHAGYYGLILANLASVAVLTIICWRCVARLKITPQYSLSRGPLGLLRSSMPFGVIGFALGFSYRFDTVLLSTFRGDVETGHYNAAYSLIFSAVVLSNVVNTALYPSLARRATEVSEKLSDVYTRALRFLIILALPIAVGTAVLAEQIVVILYGNDYKPAAVLLRILALVIPFMFVSEFLGYIVVIAGRETRVARAVLISTSLNVLLNCFMVPRFGSLGAATMTVFTEAILVGQYLWVLRADASESQWSRVLARPLVAALSMGAIALLSSGLPLVFPITLSMGAYALLLCILRVFSKEEGAVLIGYADALRNMLRGSI